MGIVITIILYIANWFVLPTLLYNISFKDLIDLINGNTTNNIDTSILNLNNEMTVQNIGNTLFKRMVIINLVFLNLGITISVLRKKIKKLKK